MTPEQIAESVKARAGAAVLAVDLAPRNPSIKLAASAWRDVAKHLRDDVGLNYLVCLTGVDRGAELEAIYTLEHLGTAPEDGARWGISVRISVPRADPSIPSVEDLWRTADWHERETWDLLGIRFEGHRNLVRILCAEDWEGHPLRKDYKAPATYHGIKNVV
ncbi:MAG TPA: NADH-quinone oxidoreductase subunit C [Planctomycetota bacterium]|nr:NADH-quinone oxidoreductase subunit C [Planctomycetota bacterium]